jgi:UrcA family protein
MPRSITILAAAALASAASPCFAQQLHTASVHVFQSDFGTAEGRAALEHRIQLAAEELCGVNAAAEDKSWGEIKRCQAGVRQEFSRKIAALKISAGTQLSAR